MAGVHVPNDVILRNPLQNPVNGELAKGYLKWHLGHPWDVLSL